MRPAPSPVCGIPAARWPLDHAAGKIDRATYSANLVLECRNSKSFHNCLCWLGLNFPHFTEDLPRASFRRGLPPGLDAAKTWNGKHACLLHLLCPNGCEAVQDSRALRVLQIMLLSNCLHKNSLCHCLSSSLHSLHRFFHSHDSQYYALEQRKEEGL